jgi:hypothetical protein
MRTFAQFQQDNYSDALIQRVAQLAEDKNIPAEEVAVMLLERFIAEQEDKETQVQLILLAEGFGQFTQNLATNVGRGVGHIANMGAQFKQGMAATRQPGQPQQPAQPQQPQQPGQQGAADPATTLQQLRQQLTGMGLGAQFDGHLKGLEQAWQQHQGQQNQNSFSNWQMTGQA